MIRLTITKKMRGWAYEALLCVDVAVTSRKEVRTIFLIEDWTREGNGWGYM
jgi:hypothetical protein